MASNIIPKLNLSLPPRKINNQPLSIFNPDTDFKTDSDVKYVDGSGDVMTGVLEVPALITNGGITLPTSYPSLPSQTQLGGVYRVATTTTMTEPMRNNLANYGQISLPAGSYIVFYHYTLTNNVITGTPTRASISLSKVNAGFAFTNNTFPSYENSQTQWGYTSTMSDNGTVGLQGTGFYQHNNATNQILYHNIYLGTTNLVTVFATLQAVRIA